MEGGLLAGRAGPGLFPREGLLSVAVVGLTMFSPEEKLEWEA